MKLVWKKAIDSLSRSATTPPNTFFLQYTSLKVILLINSIEKKYKLLRKVYY